jgi:hypothetical protein
MFLRLKSPDVYYVKLRNDENNYTLAKNCNAYLVTARKEERVSITNTCFIT